VLDQKIGEGAERAVRDIFGGNPGDQSVARSVEYLVALANVLSVND
jgi:hypothetical protein